MFYYLAKSVPCASGWYAPPAPVVRVRPQEVAHGTLVGYFLQAVEGPNVVKGVNAGAQTPMETENLSIYQGCKNKIFFLDLNFGIVFFWYFSNSTEILALNIFGSIDWY